MPLITRCVLFVALLAGAARPALAQSDTTAPDPRELGERVVARWQGVLAALPELRYDVRVKMVARDPERPARSVASFRFLAETRSTVFWSAPDRYQETVLARRTTGALGVPRGLVGAADVVSLGSDEVVLETYATRGGPDEGGPGATFGRGRGGRSSRRYAIPLPVTAGAARSYAFRVLDTLTVAGRRAFRLAVIPRRGATPLFVGTMDVADSTYDLLALDLGVNDAVAFPSVRDLRLTVRFADDGEGRWLPAELHLAGSLRPNVRVGGVPREVAGMRVSGLPERLTFEESVRYTAVRSDGDGPPWGFGEYRVVVRDPVEGAQGGAAAGWEDSATDDSLTTEEERAAWARADSLALHPPALVRARSGVSAALRVAADPGYLHYDRADGLYLGVAPVWRPSADLVVSPRVGYAWGRDAWSYRLGAQERLSTERRLWVGAEVHDEALSRPTLISRAYNPTFRALFARVDPLDYYRERGFSLLLRTRVLGRAELGLRYLDGSQSTLDTVSGFTFRSSRFPPRPNPPIVAGHLRALSASLSVDSRLLLRSGGADYRLDGGSWTRLALGVEAAAPSVIPNDFAYRRFTAQIERHQPTLGLGVTSITLAGGLATGDVPPQRYFTVDFGMDVLAVEGSGFRTLARTNYYGTRAVMLLVRHDFGRLLFARSGLPLIRNLPFTLGVDGGVFWTSFAGHVAFPGDSLLASASRPYQEVGISLGNLTPFLSPFNLSLHGAWQLSSYATRRFRLGIGISGP
jgi:hypothetical protein